MANGGPDCPPVWQYILVMGDDISASVKSLAFIGQFHKPADLEPLAQWLDQVAKEFRERVEELTGWEHE